jgi:NarL family two-component system response regulator LiaR
MTDVITILLVDDHPLVRQGIRTFLDTQPDMQVIDEADSGEEGLRLTAEYAPDVVLMDLVMPGGMDGGTATRQIKQISPRTQIIILTSFYQDKHIFPAIRAGALSYVLKDVGGPELADVVRKAVHGEAFLHPKIAQRLMQEMHGGESGAADPLHSLSQREREVLHLVADGLTNAQIAERLVISEKTVKSHVSNILGKLHLADRTQAAVFAWRKGMVE